MRYTLLTIVGAVLLGVGTAAAETKTQPTPNMESVLRFCKESYAAHKAGKEMSVYRNAVTALSDENKKLVFTVCIVYGTGFEDGTAWRGNPV